MSHENRQKVGGLTIIELYFVIGIWAYNWEGGAAYKRPCYGI